RRSAPAESVRRPRPVARRGVAGSVLWIVLVAVLLAGIVALNVAALGLQVRLDRLARERTELRAANAAISSRLSTRAATPAVETLARRRLGLVVADPGETTYLELSPRTP
ncbi:MAG: hypothetical protein H0V40_04020, partial [Actinobacteria bacterium]|nr:hypothetical protein [Actinomycetota bacterium]